MAKQLGDHPFSGKLDNVCGYQMNGKYYLKKASDVDKKKMKRDPRYKRTLEYARIFGIASTIGASIYRLIPRPRKEKKLYNIITGEAMSLLTKGLGPDEVSQQLMHAHVTGKVELTDPLEWSWVA